MGHTKEAHSLPFGHNVKAAEDIDGLIVSCSCPEIHLFAENIATPAPRGPLEVPPHRKFRGRR